MSPSPAYDAHGHMNSKRIMADSGGLAPPDHRPWAGGPPLSATSGAPSISSN